MTDHTCHCQIGDERCGWVAPEGWVCLRTRPEHRDGMEPGHEFALTTASAISGAAA